MAHIRSISFAATYPVLNDAIGLVVPIRWICIVLAVMYKHFIKGEFRTVRKLSDDNIANVII